MINPDGAESSVRRVVRARYPVTSLQQGMLFHYLLEPHAGVDIQQFVCSLPEALDVQTLREAWQLVAARHDALTTSLDWKVSGPTQLVWDGISIPFLFEDWRYDDPARQQTRLEEFLWTDRKAGFALDVAPLCRVALFRTGEAAYELVWTVHHIVTDGRSFAIVLRDVFACYERLRAGSAPSFREGPRFRDFVEWLQSQDVARAELFWRERLRGFTAPTALPYAASTVAAEEFPQPRREREVKLDVATTDALRELAEAYGLTLNTLVQGAWAILLARHSGNSDVVFGVTRACRGSTIEGADEVVGLFINTLPIRIAVPLNEPLMGWLRELRARWTELRDWEHTPLSQVQGWSDMRSGDRSLFDSIVVFAHGTLESSLRAMDASWARRSVRVCAQPNYALSLEAFDGAELHLKLGFDSARFRDGDMERALTQLTTLLGGIAAGKPEQVIREVPWVPAAERHQVVELWNETTTTYPREATVGEVFGGCVAAAPNAVAVVQGERMLSYRELDVAANRLARRLQRMGVGPGVPVGLCLRHSLETTIGVLGVLKAGGAYVPLDPAYPAERLRFMIEDTGLRAVLTLDRLKAALPDGPQRICLERDWGSIETEAPSAPACGSGPESPAYIIYTSGSTGVAKGAVITHRGVVRLVVGARYVQLGPSEVVLAFAPFSFDASTFDIWGALLNGGRLVIFEDEPTLEALGATIRRHGVTTMLLTSALLPPLVERDLDAIRPLRQLLVGGDVMSVPHARRVLEHVPQCRVINAYGPTENATITTAYRVPPDWNADGTATSVPIGRPIENTTAYVLDEWMAPVPVGVVGRLYTGGDGVALGYHNRPDLSAERFVRDAFSSGTDARLYDTGDRVRWRSDGNLEFVGRADEQLKIRGFRIEPGEVEAALRAHPAVSGALVVARGDSTGTKRLVAYVTTARAETIDPETLQAYLVGRLPAYLVPASIVVLDAFPVTANGKIDRNALPDPGAVAAEHRDYAPPQTAVERSLAAIWEVVLSIERVGVNDDFFELGGDSILTIALVSRAREAGLRITPRQLHYHPTIAELATVVVPAVPLSQPAETTGGTAPLTPIQRWFFEAETDELNYWNQAFLFSVRADLDSQLMARALGEVMGQHDALRLRFEPSGDGWSQRFEAPGADVPFEHLDLSGVADSDVNVAVEAACIHAQRSLDIVAGPILRVVHLSLGPRRRGRLFIAVHHLAVDGVSWRILIEDLEAAYTALRADRVATLPGKTTSLQLWAQQLTEFATAGGFEPQRNYWQSLVAAPSQALPRDFEGTKLSLEGDSETVTVRVDAEKTRALLQRVPAAYNTRINDVLVTALRSALRAWLGEGSVLVDLEGHGREDLFDELDLSRTVGWFTTVFPMRLELAEASPRDALRSVKESLRATPLRGFGYGALRYLVGDSVLSAAPQSELVFNYLGQFDPLVAGSTIFGFGDESTGPWRGPLARRRYAVEVNSLVLDGCLELRWAFDRKVHRAETIARVARVFVDSLLDLIAHCTSPGAGGYTPSDFPLAHLDQASLDAVAGDSRDVEDIYPLSAIQTMFALFTDPADDPGFEQWRYRLYGKLDVALLRTAWQKVVDRHSILRSTFVTEGPGEPLQLVHRRAELPWLELDLRSLDEDEQARELDELLRADRLRGFRFDRAPLMRITLVRLADDAYELIWSLHHLLIDRWSFPIVLLDVERIYRSLCAGDAAALERAVPYREYIRWLDAQDIHAAKNFWRTKLAGVPPPRTFLRRTTDALADEASNEIRVDLGKSETRALRDFARVNQIAANVVVLGAWALVVGQLTATTDLLLGLAVSGRPTDVPGVERLVGVTINDLPVRARVSDDDELLPWLRRLAVEQLDVQQFAFTPLKLVQEWSGIPWRRRLFETIIVFQHASADAQTRTWLGPDIRIEPIHTPTRTVYPLSLMVAGDDNLSLRITYDRRYFADERVRGILERLRIVLGAMCASPSQSLQTVRAALPALDESVPHESARSAERTRDFVAPASPIEAVIAGIWSELLGLEPIGARDDFFELGGQSLLAMQVVSRIRETFQVELPVRALFKAPTVAEFAHALVAAERVPGRAERIARLAQRVAEMSPEELMLAAASSTTASREPETVHGD